MKGTRGCTAKGHFEAFIYGLSDSYILCSSSSDDSTRIWNIDTSECIGSFEERIFPDSICTLSNGDTLILQPEGGLKCWRPLCTQPKDSLQPVILRYLSEEQACRSLCSLPNGCFAANSVDHVIRIWDSSTGRCNFELDAYDATDSKMISVLNTSQLASITGIGYTSIRVWNFRTGDCDWVLTGHSGAIQCISALSPAGILFASSSLDRTVRIWNVSTGRCDHVIHVGLPIVSLTALSRDRLLMQSEDQSSLLVYEKGIITRVVDGSRGKISCWCLRADGRIATASYSGRIEIWDIDSKECLFKIKKWSHNEIGCIFSLASGRLVIALNSTNMIQIFDQPLPAVSPLHAHRP